MVLHIKNVEGGERSLAYRDWCSSKLSHEKKLVRNDIYKHMSSMTGNSAATEIFQRKPYFLTVNNK